MTLTIHKVQNVQKQLLSDQRIQLRSEPDVEQSYINMDGSYYLEHQYQSAFSCRKLKLALRTKAATGNMGENLPGRRLLGYF